MPQQYDSFRIIVFIAIIIWVNAGADTSGGLLSAPALVTARLQRQRAAFAVLNSTHWGDFAPRPPNGTDVAAPPPSPPRYLNLTGFRAEDGYAWEDLGRFRNRCVEWSRNANPLVEGHSLWDIGQAEPTWQNVTGAVQGGWVRREGSVRREAADYNLTAMTPAVGWAGAHAEWGRNITGTEGNIVLRLNDKENDLEYEQLVVEGEPKSGGLVRGVAASVAIEDVAGTGTTYDMRLHGVHWPKQGAMLLTTTSEKFAGIFGLPHLTPGADFFQSSQAVLNRTLDEVLTRKERNRFSDPGNPWSSNPEGAQESWNPAPHCEYIMYVQVHPLNPNQLKRGKKSAWAGAEMVAGLVKEIEDELRYPTGAPIQTVPELQMSTVLYSPDCAYFLESKGPPLFTPAEGLHLVGMKEEVFLYEVKIWLLALAAIIFGQVHLLKSQMRESYTPSTLGRISFYTASIMVLADGMVFAAASAWSLTASTTFLPSLMVTFVGFLSLTIGGSFLSEVYKAHEPDRRRREREQAPPAAASASRPPPPPLTSDSLPRPVTAGPPRGGSGASSPPVIIPSDQDIDAEIAQNAGAGAVAVPTGGTTRPMTNNTNQGAAQVRTTFSTIAGRFILLGAFLLFLSVFATSWRAPLRSAYANTLAFVYFSLWVPQIFRNIQRNSRRALSWRFMIGQSVLRMLPFAYFYLRRHNILFAQPDWSSFAGLAAWMWAQLWGLAFQDVLGPRFGIPKSWAPEAWDYHPVLREDNVEAGGLPIGLGPSSEPGSPTLERARSMSIGGGGSESDKRLSRDKKRPAGPYTRKMDCAICCETLEVPVVRAGDEDPTAGGVAGVLARRQYMVTPCRHIFHSACLEGWLRFRLQCPICREELPPL